MKQSQSDLSAGLASDGRVSHQAYTNLVKASWILIDVIAKHPQFNLLDPSIQYDAEVLAEVSRYHDNLKTWESFLKDSIRLLETNLRIWIARSFKSPHLRIFNFVTLAFGRRK